MRAIELRDLVAGRLRRKTVCAARRGMVVRAVPLIGWCVRRQDRSSDQPACCDSNRHVQNAATLLSLNAGPVQVAAVLSAADGAVRTAFIVRLATATDLVWFRDAPIDRTLVRDIHEFLCARARGNAWLGRS